jgi:hypothetical protein
MSTFITLLGTLGAIALIGGYGLVSSARISGDSLTYQITNLSGALALMVNSAYHSAWPSAILNVVWSCIGVAAIGRVVATRAQLRATRTSADPAA